MVEQRQPALLEEEKSFPPFSMSRRVGELQEKLRLLAESRFTPPGWRRSLRGGSTALLTAIPNPLLLNLS